MKAVPSIGFAKASAQSLIKTCFGALQCVILHSWSLKESDAMNWFGVFRIIPAKSLRDYILAWAQKDATQLCLYNPHVEQLRKVLVFFPWARSLGPQVDQAYSEVMGQKERQWDNSANLQMLSFHQKTWGYHVQWLRALPSEAHEFELWLAHLLAVWL